MVKWLWLISVASVRRILNGERDDLLSPNLDKLSWPSRPSFKVTDFDLDLGSLGNHLGSDHLEDESSEDSDDYAGDSDEDDEEGSI